MKQDHDEFTFAWRIMIIMIPIQLVITYLYVNGLGDQPIDTTGFGIISVTFLLTYVLFYGMRTHVGRDRITVSFGIGLVQKRIALSRITSVEKVSTPWYYGWGIRFIPKGMLFNMSGPDGVELKFSDTHRVIRIGTPDSSVLKSAIEERLQ